MLLMLAGGVVAQPRLRQAEYYLGVQGGVTLSTAIFRPTVQHITPFTETAQIGGSGGLVFRYSGHKSCGLQLEVNYLQCGWREVDKFSDINYSRKLSYINVPFLTHIYFGNKSARGFINIGPQISYCIQDVSSGTKNPAHYHQYEPIDTKFDWGVAGSVGFYYNTKKAGTYQVEARFAYSLGTFFQTKSSDFFSQANHMVAGVNVAYLWGLHSAKGKVHSRK